MGLNSMRPRRGNYDSLPKKNPAATTGHQLPLNEGTSVAGRLKMVAIAADKQASGLEVKLRAASFGTPQASPTVAKPTSSV